MSIRSVLAAIAIAAAAAGCVSPTPYQPLVPERGGYSQERLSENRYRVVFKGNAHTRPQQVERFLLRRAAELTLENGYEWFRATGKAVEGDIRTVQTPRGPARVAQGPGYSEWANYGRFFTVSGMGFLSPVWRRVNPRAGEELEARAEIQFGKGPPPQGQEVMDARRLLEELGR